MFPLTRIKGEIKTLNFIGFDTETTINDSGEQTFLLGTVYNDKEQKVFYERKDMETFLLNYDAHTIRIASNLAFDFDILYSENPLYNRFKRITTNGLRKCETLSINHHKSIVFWDTYNFIQWSLEKYGKLLNLPKIEHPKFLGKYPKTSAEWRELETYCMRDSEITYKFACFLQSGFNTAGTNMRMTIGQTAVNLWKTKYLPCTIYDEKGEQGERIFQAYYGGRTEIFSRGLYKVGFKVFDINSMYPYIMTQEYPLPNSAHFTHKTTSTLFEYPGISQVSMSTDMDIPILPVRADKVIFPKGVIKGVYDHSSINYALNQGYTLLGHEWCLYYDRSFYPFKAYVEDLYDKRKELKAQGLSEELIYKLLLNSLYGKTGARWIEEEIPIDLNDREDFEQKIAKYPEGKLTLPEDASKGYMTIKRQAKGSYIKPILAVYTTSRARCLLHEYILKYRAGYCDTDSIICRKDIPTGNKIGQMKLEAEIKEGIFIKPKAYTYEDINGKHVYRFKGVKRMDEEKMQKILRHEKVDYMKFTRYRESIKRGLKVNTVINMSKLNSLEDNKRVWKLSFNPFIHDATSEARTI